MRRLDQYRANLTGLAQACDQDAANPSIISGIIGQFAVQFELGWKLLREMLLEDGINSFALGSPRGVIKEAFAVYPFLDGELWLDMLEDRNRALHPYDEALARQTADRILASYIPGFGALAAAAENWLSDRTEGAAAGN